MRPASRSARPSNGSTSSPRFSPFSETAIALIVKSRRWRSSWIVPARRWEHGGRTVGLAAGGDEVEALVLAVEDDRGPELLVGADASVELSRPRRGRGDRVALDDDVDVEVRLAEQDVADGAADEVHALVGLVDGHDRVERGRDALRELERRHFAVILPC